MKAEIRSYFATPVILATLPDVEPVNADLRRVILERERGDAGVRHSNLGGWQSNWDFENWGGLNAKKILDAARNLATRLTSDRAGKPVRIAWKTNAWANVNRRGHGNEFHTHPGAYWSGTYYVDDGGIGDEDTGLIDEPGRATGRDELEPRAIPGHVDGGSRRQPQRVAQRLRDDDPADGIDGHLHWEQATRRLPIPPASATTE